MPHFAHVDEVHEFGILLLHLNHDEGLFQRFIADELQLQIVHVLR
jgi:hypothetical protein